MTDIFTSTRGHEYRKGMIFLGVDEKTKAEIGIATERHALTIGGARSGKGAAQIIPNAKRWPHNLLNIDPTGENVEESWQDREAMGHQVYVLDPFHRANVPDRLRASCNLLPAIKADSPTAREDIRAIADGCVMRFKAEDGTWDNGAVSVIAGLIAYVLETQPPEHQSLADVRAILNLPDENLRNVWKMMAGVDPDDPTAPPFQGCEKFGNLAKAAAAIGLSKTKKNQEFVGGARDHTEWLDSEPIANALSGTGRTFHPSMLKTKDVSVFLVIPAEMLKEHSRFLRLFVRASLDAMSAGGKKGNRCLFMLDEFYSLGRIDQIATAAGALPKYGVVLWPFLQDLGQIIQLYGSEGAQTFFANSDAHIFFVSVVLRPRL